jgi:hypothetical protein
MAAQSRDADCSTVGGQVRDPPVALDLLAPTARRLTARWLPTLVGVDLDGTRVSRREHGRSDHRVCRGAEEVFEQIHVRGEELTGGAVSGEELWQMVSLIDADPGFEGPAPAGLQDRPRGQQTAADREASIELQGKVAIVRCLGA